MSKPALRFGIVDHFHRYLSQTRFALDISLPSAPVDATVPNGLLIFQDTGIKLSLPVSTAAGG
jgi:hypothetical protein